MSASKNLPEILAPAGNQATMEAALAAGANAIYFGIREYNARLRADNFSLSDLPQVMERLHQYGRKGYLTLNTLLMADELADLKEKLPQIVESHIDALIVTDLGLIDYLHCHYPQLPLHASTQLTTTNSAGCHYLEELGITRVVLARELTLQEIASIKEETTLELEAFCHGAHCISYSGQCQASEALLGRSANRGLCAQLCRQKYALAGDKNYSYLLSPQDLQAIQLLPEMLAAGVISFKIEGRLKSPAYVYAVTSAYRQALDAHLAQKPWPREVLPTLQQVFNRHPGNGYLKGPDYRAFVTAKESSFQGTVIGQLLAIEPHALLIKPLSDAPAINNGDGIAVGQPAANVTNDPFAQGGKLFSTTPCQWQGQQALKLAIGPNSLNPRLFRKDLLVFKNLDQNLQNQLTKAQKRTPPVLPAWPLDLQVTSTPTGLELLWQLHYAPKTTLSFVQNKQQPGGQTPWALITKQLSRLGGTPFYLQETTLTGGPHECLSVAITPGELNQWRREACDYFLNAIKQGHFIEFVQESGPVTTIETTTPSSNHYSIICRHRDQLAAVLESGRKWENIWLDFPQMPMATDLARLAGENWGLALPFIQLPGDTLQDYLALNPPALLVRTLGQLPQLRDYPGELVGDTGLNLTNPQAAESLLVMGLQRYSPAWEWYHQPEQTPLLPQAEKLLYTHRPLYLTRHCLLAAAHGRRNCQSCPGFCKQPSTTTLHSEDRKQQMVLLTRTGQYSLLLAQKAERPCKAAPAGYYRIELLAENNQETAEIISGLL